MALQGLAGAGAPVTAQLAGAPAALTGGAVLFAVAAGLMRAAPPDPAPAGSP